MLSAASYWLFLFGILFFILTRRPAGASLGRNMATAVSTGAIFGCYLTWLPAASPDNTPLSLLIWCAHIAVPLYVMCILSDLVYGRKIVALRTLAATCVGVAMAGIAIWYLFYV